MVSNSTSYEWNIVTFFRAYHPAGQILQRPLPHWLNLKTILFSTGSVFCAHVPSLNPLYCSHKTPPIPYNPGWGEGVKDIDVWFSTFNNSTLYNVVNL